MATIRDRYILEVDTRGATSSLNGFKTALGAIITVAATQQLLSLTAKFENLRTTLNTVTGSVQAGADAFDFIRDFAATTQFGIDELAQSFIKLQAAGITPTERLFRTFADTAAVTTDQIGALQAVTDLLSRTTGGGLGLEDLERLADRGIPVYRILQEEIGLTRLELSEFGQTAKGARTIVESLLTGLEKQFGGATATQLNNLSTIMSNFRNQVEETIVAFGEGISPAVKEVVRDLTEFLDSNEDVARALGQVSGEFVRLFAEAIKGLAESLDALSGEGIKNLFADLLVGLGEFINSFNTAINTAINGLGRIANTIADIQGVFDNKLTLEADTNVDDLLQELKIYQGFLQDTVDGMNGLEKAADNLITNSPLLGNLLFGETVTDQLNAVTAQIEAIESGNYFVKLNENMGNTAATAGTLGDKIIAIGEELRNSAAAVEFYPDHIYRIAEAQRRLAEQTSNFINDVNDDDNFDPGPAATYFDKLIESSRASVDEMAYAAMAVEGLNEALRTGVINPDVYAEAMERLNNTLDIKDASDKIQTYGEYLAEVQKQADTNIRTEQNRLRLIAEINAAVAENGVLTARQREMLALLDEKYQDIGSSEERYEAFMRQLNTTVRESIDTDVFKVKAMAEVQSQLEQNIISTETYERYMNLLDDSFMTAAERAKELEDALKRVSEETDRYVESADSRVRSARNAAELAGLEGIQRQLREIQIEEQNLAQDAKRRIAEQLGETANQNELASAYGRIDAAMQRNIQVRSQMAQVIEDQKLAEEQAQRSFEYGWKEAFKTYQDNATNAAENAGKIFDKVTGGMEDAIVNFAKTGKFEFKSFAASVLEDILRIQVRKTIAGLLGGTSSGSNNLFAGFFANGGTIPAGQFGIAGEAGPELISGPATVTPLSNQTVNYYIQAVDAPSFRQLVARDPQFIHAVATKGGSAIPARR